MALAAVILSVISIIEYMMLWEQDWLQLICLSIERQHVKLSSADKSWQNGTPIAFSWKKKRKK
jgi:hypothetical protein